MINMNTINLAIQDLIENSSYFGTDYEVEIGQPLNRDPMRKWVGIYRESVEYDPKFLGKGTGMKNYLADMSTKIILQQFAIHEKEADLEEQVDAFLTLINDDKSLSNTVSMVMGLSVTYDFVIDEEESFYFQMATVTIKSQARS